MDTPLDIKIRAALNDRRGQWLQIAKRCQVSHSWISQFVREKIPNPGYMTLRRLEAELFQFVQHPEGHAAEAAHG